MGKQVVEYLYFSKKDLNEAILEIFQEVLSCYGVNSQIKYEFEGKVFYFDFETITYNESLHVIYKYEKNGRVGINEVVAFQEFLNEVNIKLSMKKLNSTTLLDTNALFFSKKLIPYLHKYEWSIRKFIYLLSPSYFTGPWIEESISEEKRKAIKKNLEGKYDSNNLLQEMTLFDLEDYLFGRNYISVSIENEENVVRFRELNSENLLSYICNNGAVVSNPFSLWEEIFNKYVDIELDEIHEDMKLIRKGRNTVGHNKELKSSIYSELIKKLKKYIGHLENAFQKILTGDVEKEDINIVADDFEGYIKNHWIRKDKVDYEITENILDTLSIIHKYAENPWKTSAKSFSETMSEITKVNMNSWKLPLNTFSEAIPTFKQINTNSWTVPAKSLSETMSEITKVNMNSWKLPLNTFSEAIPTFKQINTNSWTTPAESFKNMMPEFEIKTFDQRE
ncbi:TPA: hypothetical protein ACNIGD_001408 [Enterococcus faecalis]